MSLLLKALKQAEAANAEQPDSARGNFRVEGDLELEPALPGTASTREWVEPPGLLFGSSGVAPEPRRSILSHMPQLSLVPLTALVAALIAAGYGLYLYFALQPPAAPETPPVARNTPAVESPVAPATRVAPAALEVPEVTPVDALRPQSTPTPSAVAPATLTVAAAARTPSVRAGEDDAPASPPPAGMALRFRPDAQSSLLTQAHAAYQRGAFDESLRLYARAADTAPSVDALLGMAAIASVQNRETDAQRLYRAVLDLDPRNATAQAALLDLLGNTDSGAAESRLKMLIEREPSPHLYQTLGNLYAEQNRWSDAQAAYFEAYRGAADNADYAYNLAVSLDQLRQYPAALTYYGKALANGGVHRFDRALAEARVQQLKTLP